MKVLCFGETGQVARALVQQCPQDWKIETIGRNSVDFSDVDRLRQCVLNSDADVIINAVAYTAVDLAERDEALATQINGQSVGVLAKAAAQTRKPLLHISTDYVFDGHGSAPWQVDAPTNPIGAYGRSKLVGEKAVRAAMGSHAILRTSWVFSATGANFVKTMLKLGQERDSLNVVSDQIGGPTSAADISSTLFIIATHLVSNTAKTGTYHFAGAPSVSWADFAREIFRQSGIDCRVNDIPAVDYPTPAKRPANSRLDCSSLASAFEIEQPDWRLSLSKVLAELKGKTP